MDESRARALLRAERAEVATLLRETEESESDGEQAPDSPQDFGDEGLALTEEEDEATSPTSCASGWPRSTGRWPGSRPATTVSPCSAASRSRPTRLEADPAAELTVEEARAHR